MTFFPPPSRGGRQTSRSADERRPPGWEAGDRTAGDRQHGVVSNGQLRGLGLDREAVRRRVATGYLHRIHHAVYAVGHGSLSLNGRYLAAVLAGGSSAALSHRAAADLWSLRAGPARVAVTVPHGRRGIPRVLEVHRSRMFHPGDFTQRDGIPVTTVARTCWISRASSHRASWRARSTRRSDSTCSTSGLWRTCWRVPVAAGAQRPCAGPWPSGDHARRGASWRTGLRSCSPPPNCRDRDSTSYSTATGPSTRSTRSGPRNGSSSSLTDSPFTGPAGDRERDAATDADLELAGLRVVRLTWAEVIRHADCTVRRLAVIFGGR